MDQLPTAIACIYEGYASDMHNVQLKLYVDPSSSSSTKRRPRLLESSSVSGTTYINSFDLMYLVMISLDQ